MENLDVTIGNILEEYDKYIISKIINKSYNLNTLRNLVREFSNKSDLIVYNESDSDYKVLDSVRKLIR